MKINSILYCIGQGFRNIVKNGWHSLASMLTMGACIFLLCLSVCIVGNVSHMVAEAETDIGVTVFFQPELTEEQIKAIGEQIGTRSEVEHLNYVSPEEAWEKMKAQYFEDSPELAAGFENDNPLANSASYEIFLNSIEEQPAFVEYLQGIDGVRKVNYSANTVDGLTAINQVITVVCLFLILALFVVTVFLISNTIALAIQLRKEEVKIMRYIGATKSFVRAPFLIEGIIIGFFGAVLPLVLMGVVYQKAMFVFQERLGILSSLFTLLPVEQVFGILVPMALILGIGMGFIGSGMAVRKYLRA